MIHSVTIPFSFDTSPIEQKVANVGEDEVLKIVDSVVRTGIAKALPASYRYSPYGVKKNGEPDVDWAKYVGSRVDKWLEAHSQEIIDEAAVLMAMRAGRKKAWREVLAELREQDKWQS